MREVPCTAGQGREVPRPSGPTRAHVDGHADEVVGEDAAHEGDAKAEASLCGGGAGGGGPMIGQRVGQSCEADEQ
eukprot:6012535-Prymnesium_polylepis.1